MDRGFRLSPVMKTEQSVFQAAEYVQVSFRPPALDRSILIILEEQVGRCCLSICHIALAPYLLRARSFVRTVSG